MATKNMPMTGERFVPNLEGTIRLEHLHRYYLACELAKDKHVLDVACGEGYGSAILTRVARRVIGVDIAKDAVAHATANYATDITSFLEGSATSIPVEDDSVDVVVSFETIEHLAEHEEMLSEIRRVLRPDGVLLISSPNKAIYSDETGYQNPFHVKELYTDQFVELVGKTFPNVKHFAQKLVAGSVISAQYEARPFSVITEAGNDDALERWRYDLVLASAAELPALPNSLFESPDSPLDPYKVEALLKSQEDFGRLVAHNVQLTKDIDAARRDAQLAMGEMRALEKAVVRMSQDAESVISSRHWKGTRFKRRLSNSIRKLRGRPKKYWPNSFAVERYLTGIQARDAHTTIAPANRLSNANRLDLVPFHGRSEKPHLTCVSMVRNEALRADEMMRHLCALFDRIVVIDHLSTDDTAEIIARYDGHENTEVVILSGQDEGYYQSEYMTATARTLIKEERSDWLFFLDFDEFLPFQSRDTFLQALVPLTGADVIHSHWYNLATRSETFETIQGADVTIGPEVSRYTKVALNLRRLKHRDVKIAQGNHAALLEGQVYLGERAFGIFHVPVNGRKEFLQKLKQGARAYEKTKGHSSNEGSHWHELYGAFETVSKDPVVWREVALRYGEPLKEVLSDVEAGKLTDGARPLHLTFAQVDAAPRKTSDRPKAPSFNLQTIDAVMALTFPRPEPAGVPDLSKAIYQTLPGRSDPLEQSDSARAARVNHAMISAATEIEILRQPTAWSGHKAFLFSLMEAMRPRRYVELGTHAGASFFAACQHMKMNGSYGEAVAIDIWEGDHQAGFYGYDVFYEFRCILKDNFAHIGSFIRGYFSEAVNLFEPKSIDLLHIDGLHTYEAVKEDFETWRSALSDNGTIIFHDTSEYQTDFGVWQLFEEIEGQATASFRFRHCHGLGILAFGDRSLNPAIELLEHLSKNPSLSESYYSTLGSALFEQAMRRVL